MIRNHTTTLLMLSVAIHMASCSAPNPRAGTAVGTVPAESTETRALSEPSEKKLPPGLTEDSARKLAEVYAFQRLLLAIPVDAYVELESDGNWLVTFFGGFFSTPDGREYAIPVNWGLLIRVTPEGVCSGGVPGMKWVYGAVGSGGLPPGAVTEQVAVLLARIFAENNGLLDTSMNTEAAASPDGGWVFAFHPGVEIEGSRGTRVVGSPVAVYVAPSGECRIVGGPDKWPCNP